MAKKKSRKNQNGKNGNKSAKAESRVLSGRIKRWIVAIILAVLAVVVALAFFHKSGKGGDFVVKIFDFVVGQTVFALPVLFLLAGFLVLRPAKRIIAPLVAALLFLISGISGFLALRDLAGKKGGWLGTAISWPLLKYFSPTVGLVVFAALIVIGILIIGELLPRRPKEEKEAVKEEDEEEEEEFEPAPAKEKEKPKPKLEIKTLDLPKRKKEITAKESEKVEKAPSEAVAKVDDDYKRPPLNLFDTEEEKPASGDTNLNGSIIQKTFGNFGINVEMSEVNVGPTVTQYTLKPAEGVKLAKITTLNNDLALSLAAHPIRIEAPIPGRSLVGIEVPNKIKAKVKLGSLIATADFQKATAPLYMGLGQDVMGAPVFANLGGMPHLLVAGATGSGKTICLNSLIMSLIYRNSPKTMRLILIDPKRVEFPVYGDLPHLLTPVILNARKAVNALNWLVGEMERRFEVLREFGSRDIGTYNHDLAKKPKRQEEGFEQLPYIVLIIDELADLMMSKGKEVEATIVRLSQLARAVGIHLIVATQRPSVEVITGLIKANITSRIAFQVASQIDSRTILDTAGAEKLLGRGDMLYLSAEFSRPRRVQGSFISSTEINKVVSYIAKENTPEAPMQEFSETEDAESGMMIGVSNGNGAPRNLEEEITNFSAPDELYDEARKVVLQYHKASASLLQRRLQIGYARAARLLDLLETNGVVGPADGAKPRDILVESEDDKVRKEFQDPSDLEFE
ncbi:MAG: DNA translocase FtsK [Candidatus Pacebacteria bacterium]|nr:DNA translocase FtsK [Candidatus Paceibacterota bacterium]